MEVYALDNTGEELLLAIEKFDSIGANKGDFVITASDYYQDYDAVTFKFRTCLDIDDNKNNNGSIKFGGYLYIKPRRHAKRY